MMHCVDEYELAYLASRAEVLGFEIFCDNRWGFILRPIARETTNPAIDLADLREMLDGIEWGREHGAAGQSTASRLPGANGRLLRDNSSNIRSSTRTQSASAPSDQ
jgi:hypothetical protein